MSYKLEAYVAPLAVVEADHAYEVPRVWYRLTDALALVPLPGGVGLRTRWPVRASEGTTIARVSADYFGGYGGQEATVWRDGQVIAEGVEVNEALRLLGVEKRGGDEWDTVGLGRFRRTETWAAEAIRQRRDRSGPPLETLLKELRFRSFDPKVRQRVRAGAVHDLGELGDERAVPRLAAIVRARTDYGLVIAAASALARIGGSGLSELADVLREAERRPSLARRLLDRVRRREPFSYFPVVHAMGEAGPAAGPFAADLAKLLRHEEVKTRSNAAQALIKMGPSAEVAVPALIELLGDEESFNRSYAAQALGSIGPAARPALEHLRDRLEDEAYTVRESARKAMTAIDDTS